MQVWEGLYNSKCFFSAESQRRAYIHSSMRVVTLSNRCYAANRHYWPSVALWNIVARYRNIGWMNLYLPWPTKHTPQKLCLSVCPWAERRRERERGWSGVVGLLECVIYTLTCCLILQKNLCVFIKPDASRLSAQTWIGNKQKISISQELRLDETNLFWKSIS